MRTLIILIGISAVLFSCNSAAKENFKNAAQAMCDCIEKQQKYDENTPDFSNHVMHYAICSFDIEEEFQIELSESGFEKALEKICPEAMEAHLEVKDNYTLDYE